MNYFINISTSKECKIDLFPQMQPGLKRREILKSNSLPHQPLGHGSFIH
jgi:hypothetical protein